MKLNSITSFKSDNTNSSANKKHCSLTKTGFLIGGTIGGARCISKLISGNDVFGKIVEHSIKNGNSSAKAKAMTLLATGIVVAGWGVIGGSVCAGVGAIINAFKNGGKMQK